MEKKIVSNEFTSIIIVNYNTLKYTVNCIESIINYIKSVDYEIIIVENNSNDKENIQELEKKFTNVKVIISNNNLGFGAGCNLGASNSIGNNLLFLNPDISFNQDILLNFVSVKQKFGINNVYSGILKNEFEEVIYSFNNFPTLKWELKEAFGLGINKEIKKLINSNNKKDIFKIDWVIGACLFLSKKCYFKVNGFDDNFFLYYEDTDLIKRLRDLGINCLIDTSINLYHKGKSSISETEFGNSIYNLEMNKSRLLYHKKHSSYIKQMIIRTAFIWGYFFRYIKYSLKNKKNIRDESKNIFDIIKIYLNG